ncbi:MAG: sigma-70 family RNA polymerase sigma factor [Polyangiales bacterium]
MSREGEGQHPDDDVTLVARVGQRDPAALRLLFDRHAPALLRFAHAIARDRALAEDAVQESFAALWQHAASFRNESSPRSWLFTVARNAIHRRFRRKVDRDTDVALEELGADAGWGDASAQRSVHERIESDDCVRHALAALDDEDREVLALIDVEGLSTEEGAQSLGLSVAALKSRLHRARLRFVAAVRKEDDR